jgi:guanidinoacetate N-methyltransferase
MSPHMNSDAEKDKARPAQIPDWVQEFKEPEEPAVEHTPEEWKSAKPEFTPHTLQILGEPVMEDWEEPYMKVLAEIATRQGGTVLEVGFGMGISARFIQQHRITRHIIIEANHDVAEQARAWAKTCPADILILEGLWQDEIAKIPDSTLDGILFDTYPITDVEFYQNNFNFFPHAFAKLRTGGVLTYYSDEISSFSDAHMKSLLAAGFRRDRIQGTPVPVNPPADCAYWKAKTILAPVILK